MATRKQSEPERPLLKVPRSTAEAKIAARISKGRELHGTEIHEQSTFDEVRRAFYTWDEGTTAGTTLPKGNAMRPVSRRGMTFASWLDHTETAFNRSQTMGPMAWSRT